MTEYPRHLLPDQWEQLTTLDKIIFLDAAIKRREQWAEADRQNDNPTMADIQEQRRQQLQTMLDALPKPS